MGKIHFLSENIINKISAGEVVERPSFAVKELIDNSIDAKADYITIDVEEGGIKKIKITDNGVGMSREDILVCFKPHTTSKILNEEDLYSIKSLGFRGEALASISAVSDMVIISRDKEDVPGTKVEINYGRQEKIRKVSAPLGTTVIISNIFDNIPGRKGFLKTEKTEFRHIIDIIINFALAYPNVHFALKHNKKIVFDLPKFQDITTRIKVLLGENIYNNLIPIKLDDSYLKVDGFITKPQISAKTTQKQYLFVNSRQVSDKIISLAVKDAYESLIESDEYPIFILRIDIPFEAVDINVHPRKEQVNFIESKLVYEFIFKAVYKTLSENNLTFNNFQFNRPQNLTELKDFKHKRQGKTDSVAGKILKDVVNPWEFKNQSNILTNSDIQQINETYIIAQSTNGLVIIDQHAAHERILFEKFLDEFNKQKEVLEPYKMQTAIILDLSIPEAVLLEENITFFESFGFELERFKDNSFLVRTIPYIFKDRNIEEIIKEMIEDILEGKKVKSIDEKSKKMVEYLACRSAIKAGQRLTKEEALNLLDQLSNTKNNYTCPHGRPTKIEVSISQLDRLFKRH